MDIIKREIVEYSKQLSFYDNNERKRLLKELNDPYTDEEHLTVILHRIREKVRSKTPKQKAIDLINYLFSQKCYTELAQRLLEQVQKHDEGLLPKEALEQMVIKVEMEYFKNPNI